MDDLSFDVVVVGCGIAGLSAAVMAQQNRNGGSGTGDICCCDPDENPKCIKCFVFSYIGILLLIALL